MLRVRILLKWLLLKFVKLPEFTGNYTFVFPPLWYLTWCSSRNYDVRSIGRPCRHVLMCHRPFSRVEPWSRIETTGSSILRHVAAYMPKGKVYSRSTSSVLRTRLRCHWELNPHSTPFMRTGDLRLESKRGAANEFTETPQLQWNVCEF